MTSFLANHSCLIGSDQNERNYNEMLNDDYVIHIWICLHV